MWTKILIPLDGSELADRIMGLLGRILDRRSVLSEVGDVRLELLRVVTPAELRRGEQLARDELAVARGQLERARDELGARGRDASCAVVVGDPAAVILDVAERDDPSLIAMSTHGRTGVERWIRGSVAERVLRESSCPVLLANPFALETTRAPGALPFQRILVPLDGSDRAAEILPRVAAIARLFDSEVILLNVVSSFLIDDETGLGLKLLEEEGRAALEKARARLGSLKVRTKLDYGAPASVILQAMIDDQVDLLALATHGRSGVSRWVLGSVAEDVLRHGRCPLLVQRTAPMPAARAVSARPGTSAA